MKRTRFIALALVVAIMLMGAGYAAWSDRVFLDTTIRTGNFDMQITEVSARTGNNGLRQAANATHGWHWFDWTAQNNSNIGIDVNKTTATVELLDLYPGGVVQVDMKTKNMGTIPAKLSSINVEYLGGNSDLFYSLLAKSTWKADVDGAGYVQNAAGSKWSHVLPAEWLPLQAAMDKLVADTVTKNLIIEPNGYFALGLDEENEEGCIQFKLAESAGNALQNQSVRFKVTFNWDQWTTTPNASNSYLIYGGDGDLQ